MEEKRFREWMIVKETMHNQHIIYNIKEGDIWWCAIGENVGIEINGKNDTFSRPVLIMRKLSRYGFLGIPLTSQLHTGDWYAPFDFKGKKQYAAMAQIRVLSVSRLYKRMGAVPNSDLELVRTCFRKLYM